MGTWQLIICFLCAVFITISTILIYDARKITKTYFGNNDINEITKLLKISGFIIIVVSALIIMLIFNKGAI